MRNLPRLIAVVTVAALAPLTLLAQEAATVSGRVTNAQGQPVAAVLVSIPGLSVGSTTGPDGAYRLVVPGARVRAGQTVQLTASRAGLAPATQTITLCPGAHPTQNFHVANQIILLEDVVVTGTAGAVEARRGQSEVGQVSAERIRRAPRGEAVAETVVSGSGRPGTAPSEPSCSPRAAP